MSAWQEEASCRDQAPGWDFELAETKTAPMPLIHAARVCAACPVKKQCETWADQEAADGDGGLGFLAAGYLYNRRGYGGKLKVEWKTCDLPDCDTLMPARNTHREIRKFCSDSCAARYRHSLRRVAS